jgi:lipoprotein NlpI
LGIEAKPVLLDIGRRSGLDKSLPSPLLFNHAIVQVTMNGRAYYLDPTRLGQYGRLSRMGQVHEGAQVLVVAPQVQRLVNIASPNSRELVRNEVVETATLAKFDGDGQFQVRQLWHGAVAESLRVLQERVPRDQLYRSIGGALEQRYPGATLVGEPVIKDDRVDNVMSMTATYTVPKLASERDGNYFVRFAPDNMKGILTRPPPPGRTVPLQLAIFPFDAKYTFEITLPDDVRAVTDPHTQAVKSKYFTYAVTSSFRGNVSKTAIELATLADQVPVADLRQYGDDLRAVTNILAGVVAVPKSAIKGPGAARTAKKDLGQMLRDRQQETVDNTTKAIKSGKLAGSDLVSAFCLRGTAYSDLGKFSEAIADGNEAVRTAPGSTSALLCRGSAYYNASEFEKSIEDYSKAITLGSTGPRTLFQRGIARFYAGRLEEASEDFTRATETDDREGQVTYDLWLAWTSLRLGKPLPEAVRARAAEQPRGDWPRPALAVFSGNVTPDEMLKLIERKGGDERKMALSEGYFYLAQYYLGQGDKAKARKYLQESRRQNVIIYTEHAAAAFELKRLGSPTETGSLPAPGTAKETGNPRVAPSAEKKSSRKAPRKANEPWNSNLWRQ